MYNKKSNEFFSLLFLAETERFELSYAGKGVTAFRVRLVATTSIRFRFFCDVLFYNSQKTFMIIS